MLDTTSAATCSDCYPNKHQLVSTDSIAVGEKEEWSATYRSPQVRLCLVRRSLRVNSERHVYGKISMLM